MKLVTSVFRDWYLPRTDSRVDMQTAGCPKTQAVSSNTENLRAFRILSLRLNQLVANHLGGHGWPRYHVRLQSFLVGSRLLKES